MRVTSLTERLGAADLVSHYCKRMCKGFNVCGQKGGWEDTVMVNLHCQPDWIWNHLGDRSLGVSVDAFTGTPL